MHKTKLKSPCELMVRKVLPSVRAAVAQAMVFEKGMLKQDVAQILGVSNAAVSQYISSKRGSKADYSDEIKYEILNFVDLMCNDENTHSLDLSFCDICKIIQTKDGPYRQHGTSGKEPDKSIYGDYENDNEGGDNSSSNICDLHGDQVEILKKKVSELPVYDGNICGCL